MTASKLTVRIGNLFDSHAQTFVNTVNCAGVMGAGIALEYKKRFPAMYRDYVERCKRGEVHPGRPYFYPTLYQPSILNFPTKSHWKQHSRMEDIEKGLRHVRDHCEAWGITSLAIPALGCGKGGLTWHDVGPVMYRHLIRTNIPVEVFAPHGTPLEELEERFLAQLVTDPYVSTAP